jgi:uncharacterized membrane protein YoaK (UPF0700 family)
LHLANAPPDDLFMPPAPRSEDAAAGDAHHLLEAVIDERDGPLPALMLTLTVLVGIVDATSILLAHVFVASMTGNIVFLGLALARAPGFSIGGSLLPIAAFSVGAVLGNHAIHAAGPHRGRALRNVLGVKMGLAVVVVIVVVTAHNHFGARTRDYIVILLALSMGSQLAAIRNLAVRDLPTVVLTLTITGALVEASRGLNDPVMLRRVLAVLAFLLGVLAGGLLVRHVSVGASLGLGLAIIVGVAIAAHLVSREGNEAWAVKR